MQDTLLKVLLGFIAVFMAANGLGFWFAIDSINPLYALSTTSDLGRASIRADFGGFFLAVAIVTAYALWNRSALAATSAALLFLLALSGRFVSIVLDGVVPETGGTAMLFEASSAAVLLWVRSKFS